MFRGGSEKLGVGRQTGGPQYISIIRGVGFGVLAKAVSRPDCTVMSIMIVNMSAFHLC
jgi:hypothetical protein